MNKSDLIEHIAKQADISKAAAGRALESVVSGIKSTLKKNGSVTLVGFGTFSVGKRDNTVDREHVIEHVAAIASLSSVSARTVWIADVRIRPTAVGKKKSMKEAPFTLPISSYAISCPMAIPKASVSPPCTCPSMISGLMRVPQSSSA